MKHLLVYLSILSLAVILLTININKPFIGQHDWNGVVYGQQAKNFVRYGYLPLRFAATADVGLHPVNELKFTTHYTPVLPILISLLYRTFGISEWSTRLVAIIASLFTIVLIINLGKVIFDRPTGILAGILTSFTPMFIYYGKNPVHEIVQLPFTLMSFLSYYSWFKSGKNIWWYSLFLFVILAMMIGWPGYYALGLITLHGILFSQYKKRFYLLPLIAFCLFILFIWHINTVNPESVSDLAQVAKNRIGYNHFPLLDYIIHEIRFMVNLFSAAVLVFSGLWSLSFFYKSFASRVISPSRLLLIFIGIFGILHVSVFQNAGWYHEYLLFPLLPFLAISSANFIVNLSHKIPFLIISQTFLWLAPFLVAFERIDYAKALLASEYIRTAYEDGLQSSRRLEMGEKLTYLKDGWVYFVFYADRL